MAARRCNDGLGTGGVERSTALLAGQRSGILRGPTGDVYEGEQKDDQPHGKGVCRYASGHEYEGQWVEGNRHGRGTMHYPSGDVYDGEWKNDERHGRGICRLVSGVVYDGEFEGGKYHGIGTYTTPSGDVYTGQIEEGKPHGRGKLTQKDGEVCEGQWVGGKLHGEGTETRANGDVYEGSWKNGKEHGRGTLAFACGDVYEGEFKDGKQHGKGVMKLATGDVYEGRWIDGRETHEKVKCGEEEGGIGANPRGQSENRAHGASGNDQSEEEKRIYNHERTLRSQRSQQRRLQKDTRAKETCEHCGADDGRYKLRVCSGCNLALYCSAACHKAASGSHRRICNIMSQLPSKDADRLILKYGREKMVDLDAGLRYATKYMSNMKHLEINVEEMVAGDTVKLSAKRLRSLLKRKKGTLDSVFWLSNIYINIRGIGGHDDTVWKEMHGLKQLRLEYMKFDSVQLIHDIICQQRDTLTVLCLPFLEIPWSKAKCRRAFAQAVNSCKNLVKLEFAHCMLMDSDLKIMLNGLPNLRVLSLVRDTATGHEFSDNTCSLIARKCPGLQELELSYHDHLSLKGISKILEGCVHLRVFLTTICNLSCEDVRNLLDIAPQLLYLSLNKKVGIAEKEIDGIIEATGGRTLIQFNDEGNCYVYEPGEILSDETRAKYQHQKQLGCEMIDKSKDPEVANQWEVLLD